MIGREDEIGSSVSIIALQGPKVNVVATRRSKGAITPTPLSLVSESVV